LEVFVKLCALFAVVLFSSIGFAATETPEHLPAKLVCKAATASSKLARSFRIEKLDTKQPETTIEDAELLDLSADQSLVQVSFSNQCDNDYSFVFFTTDLQALTDGSLKEVKGLLNYFNAQLTDIKPSTNQTGETVPVVCSLK
jgi:hypothetical protein